MSWSISTDRSTWSSFADAGICDASLRFIACGVDTCDLTIDGDYLASPLASAGTTLYIRQGAAQRFIGRVTGIPRHARGTAQRYTVQLSGGWWWLERTPALQRWGDGSEAGVYSAHVIIGQSASGSAVALSVSLAEILASSISQRSVPIEVGTITAMVTLPSFSVSNQRVSDVILACLRWQPDHVVTWDYSGETPSISIVRPSAETPVSIDLDIYPPVDIAVTPRTADVVPGVRVVYETQSVVDGEAVNSYTVDTAGTSSDPLCVEVLFPLRGASSSTQTQTQSIVCEPVSSDSKSFWRNIFFGTLGSVADDDWSIVDVESPGGSHYAYRLIQGVITGWMRTDPTNWVSAGRETWTLVVAIICRDSDGNPVRTEIRRLAARWIGCASPTATFTHQSSSVSGAAEAIPSGVAAAIYASWSRIQYDGQVSWDADDCNGLFTIGAPVRLTNGLAAWATMDAQVREIQHRVSSGSTSIAFGPAARLEPDAALAISRASRGFRASAVTRDASSAPPVDTVLGMELAAELTLSEGEPGIPSQLAVEDADKIIDLDTDAIVGDEDTPSLFTPLMPRKIWEAVPAFDEDTGYLEKITFQQREAIVSDIQGTPVEVTVIDCDSGGGEAG